MRRWSIYSALLAFAAGILSAQQAIDVRALFLDVERTARLPEGKQPVEIRRIYNDVWMVIERNMLSATTYRFSPIERTADGRLLTPEELASAYEQSGGMSILAEAARIRCRRLLAVHTGIIEPLVTADLQTTSQDRLRRGLYATGEFKLSSEYGLVTNLLNSPVDVYAAQALRDLDDPRAIPLLVDSGIVRHFEVLRHLQRKRPAHPSLTKLLESNDGDVRWRTAYALAESADPALIPAVRRLAADEEPEVRSEAAGIGFNLPTAAFAEVRPALVKLLDDPSIPVRSWVATLFAAREDKVCAKALYDLLVHEELLEAWRQSNVVQAMNTLSGSYFGFTPGTISTPEVRRASLERFAHWIAENSAAK